MRNHVVCRPSVVLVLGQRRGQLSGIEPTMGCDASPILNRNLVGRTFVRGFNNEVLSMSVTVLSDSLASIDWMLTSTGDGGGRSTH